MNLFRRDRAQLLACEKRLKIENEDLKKAIARHQEVERRGDKRKLTDEEYQRKVTKYEDVISQLQKNVTAHKQEEEALLNEMEVTGQAFEDMQEQNIRLMQQLREKDDANFKLMSERIKSNQIHKMLKEEKDLLTENIITMQVGLFRNCFFYLLIHIFISFIESIGGTNSSYPQVGREGTHFVNSCSKPRKGNFLSPASDRFS